MDAHGLMNSTLTRVQAFAVVALCAILLLGGLGTMLLVRMDGRSAEAAALVMPSHGIETSWRSGSGSHRLWSLTGRGDYRPWLEDHVAAFTEAQRLLPLEEK